MLTLPVSPLQLACNDPFNPVAIGNWIATASASDNVALDEVNGFSNNYSAIAQSCGLVQPVLFTAKDHCGLTTTGSVAIQYADIVPPVVSCPASVLVECASNVPVKINNQVDFQSKGGDYSDNCDPNPSLSWVSDVISSQTCPNAFILTRTYKVIDQCLNETSCSQIITVNPITAPFIPILPGSSTVECIAQAVQPTPPSVNDACGTPIVPTVVASPDPACEGVKRYTFTYKDCLGLTSEWVYEYIIQKTKGIDDLGNYDEIVTCPSLADVPPDPATFPVFKDFCGNVLTPVLFSVFESPSYPCKQGSNDAIKRYRYKYTDCDNNEQLWSYTYTIVMPPPDLAAPVSQTVCIIPNSPVTVPLPSLTLSCLTNTITYSITGATSRSGSGLDASGLFNLGIHTITWTVTDACNITVVASFQFTVKELPAATVSGSIISCPGSPVIIPVSVSGAGTITGTLSPGNIPFNGTAPTINVSVASPSVTTNYTVNTLNLDGCAGTSSGLYTVSIPVGAPGEWTCSFSNDWFDCRNWAGGLVPTSSTNVVIPAIAACGPVIDPSSLFAPGDGMAYSNNITLNGNGLSMVSGSTLNVSGNWVNNVGDCINTPSLSGFCAAGGTVVFAGNGAQTIYSAGSSGEKFNNLVMNKPCGGDAANGLTLNSPVNTGGKLTLNGGVVNSSLVNILNITNCDSAAIDGGSNNSYINGELRRCTNSTDVYILPVGDPDRPGGAYRPAYVEPATGTISHYTARYYSGTVPVDNFSGVGLDVTGVINNEQWYVKGEDGSCSASVGVYYIPPTSNDDWTPMGPIGCTDCNVGIVNYRGGGDWNLTGDDGNFSNSRPEYLDSDVNGRVYSKFIDLCTADPHFTIGFALWKILPNQFLTFSGLLHNKHAWLQWTVADNEEVLSFTIEHSANGVNFAKAGQVIKGNNPAYQFLHEGLVLGNNYYRVKLQGKYGTSQYSRVVVIPYARIITCLTGINPTLVQDLTHLTLISAGEQAVQIRIFDMRGRLIRTEKINIHPGNNNIPVYMRGLSNAMYMVNVLTEDGARGNYKVLKE